VCILLVLITFKAIPSRYRPGVAQRVSRRITLLFHDRDTRRGWVVSTRPGRTLPPGKTRYPFYRRLGGPQGRSGRAENLVSTGIRSRTVQPVDQSLYRLSYRAHGSYYITKENWFRIARLYYFFVRNDFIQWSVVLHTHDTQVIWSLHNVLSYVVVCCVFFRSMFNLLVSHSPWFHLWFGRPTRPYVCVSECARLHFVPSTWSCHTHI